MREHLGHRARWTATLVVAPCAAAVFGAAVIWAAQTEPPKSATTISHAKAAAARSALRPRDTAADSRTAAMRRESAHGRQAATAMHRDLVALQAQLSRLQSGDDSDSGSAAAALHVAALRGGPGPAALPATGGCPTRRPLAARVR